MLILILKDGDSVRIGDDIVVTALPRRVYQGQVTTGHAEIAIQAPRDIEIDREEVRNRKLQSGKPFKPIQTWNKE